MKIKTLLLNRISAILLFALFAFSANAQLQITTSTNVSDCSSNGTISVSVTGGTAPYCYDLTPCTNCQACINQKLYTFSSLAPGTYQVKVTDNSTPVQVQTATVTVKGTYTPVTLLGKVTTCGVVGSAKGGKKPYTFSISTDGKTFGTSQKDSTFNALNPGEYYIRCTDACGNYVTYKTTLPGEELTFASICNQTGKKKDSLNIVITGMGGAKPYKYQVVNGNDSTAWSAVSTYNIKRSCAQVKVKIQDACDRIKYESLACLRLEPEVLCGNCSKGEFTLKVSGGTPPYNFYTLDNLNNSIPNPNGLKNPIFKGLSPISGARKFQVTDSCGAIGIISYACLDEDLVYVLDKKMVMVSPGADYKANNPRPPYTITCETCVPKETIKTDSSATFKVCGPQKFSITDACGATMFKTTTGPALIGKYTAGCNFIKANTLIGTTSSEGKCPPSTGIRPLYVLFDSKGVFVDSNRTGNFNNLALGTYNLTISAPCWSDFKTPVQLVKDKFKLQLSMASGKDATGRCVPMWDVIAIGPAGANSTISGGPGNLVNAPLISLFTDSTTQSQYNRIRVMPGKYTIKSSAICLSDTTITLPNIVIEPLKYVAPKCPSDPTIILETLHNSNYWYSYWAGTSLQIPVINYDGDFTTLDCILGAPGCAKNTTGQYINQVIGTSHKAYLYLGNDDNACPLDTLDFIFKAGTYKAPDSLAIDYFLCAGSTSGSLTASVKGGSGPYTLKMLDGPNGNVLATVSGDQKDLILTNVKPGDYFFLIIDACGNTKDSKKTIKQEFVLMADVKAQSCTNSFVFSATKVPNAIYTWTNLTTGAVITSGLDLYNTTVVLNNAQNASIGISVKLKDCVIFEKTFPVGTAAALAASIAVVTTSSCGAKLVGTGIGGSAPYTYKWSDNSINAELLNAKSGTYSLTVTDKNGCTTTTTTTVTASNSFNATASVITNADCTANLTASGVSGSLPYTYKWSNGAATSLATSVKNGNYAVTVTDKEGCSAIANVVVALVAPTVSIIPNIKDSKTGEKINFSAVVGATPAIKTFTWSATADSLKALGQLAILTVTKATTITVTAIAVNGCTATATATVTVPSDIKMPLAFSPNSATNENKTFKPAVKDNITIKKIQVYNRWGNLLHDSSADWDGGDAPSDTYLYLVYYTEGGSTDEKVIKGDVTLLR